MSQYTKSILFVQYDFMLLGTCFDRVVVRCVAVLLDDVHVVGGRSRVKFGVFVLRRINCALATIQSQLITQFDSSISALYHGFDFLGLNDDSVIQLNFVHRAFDAFNLNSSAAIIDQGNSES